MALQPLFIRDWNQLSAYLQLKPRLVWVPKFSINECNEKFFKLPNAENLFNS